MGIRLRLKKFSATRPETSSMGSWTGSEVKTRLSEAVRDCDVIASAMLAVAFCFVIVFGGRIMWSIAVLLSGALAISWRTGRTAGLIASVLAAVSFRLLCSGLANISMVLSFLLLCAALSWVLASYRHQWNEMQTERDEMRIMVDHAPLGIALLDKNRRVLRCNPTFREIYGWNEEDIVGRTPPLPESQRESWAGLIEHLQSGKSFVNIETLRARKDGSRFYARISGSPIFSHSAVLIGLVGFIARTDDGCHSDLLELKNLESLVQSSSEFMCVAQLDGRTFFLNDAGKDMIGLSDEAEINDMPLERFFNYEDQDRIKEILRLLPLQRIGLSSQTIHLKQFQTGGRIAVSCSFHVISDPLTQEPSSLACVAKSSGPDDAWGQEDRCDEEVFRAFFHNAPIAIVLVDTAGGPFESNALFQEMLGYEVEELRQMRFGQLVHPEDSPAGRKLFLSLMEGKIGRYQVNKRLVSRNGEVLFTKMTVALMRDREGKPSYAISMVERVAQGSMR